MAPKVQVTISAKNFATTEFNKVTKSLTSVRNNSAKSNLALKTLDSQTSKVTKSMASLAKVGVASGLAGFAAILSTSIKAIKEASELETVSTQFEVLTGSVANATKMLSSLRSFAASTPLSFDTISDGAKNLLAFGVGLDDVQGKLQQVGDLSMGNSEKMMTLVSAYGKIRAKGKASLEEINRFTENGVPLLDEMATNLNITTEELMKMITAGKIGLPEVESAMSSLTSEGGKFNAMLEKQSKTLSGQWSTFKDNIIQNLQTVGMTSLPTVKTALEKVSTALTTLTSSKDFQSFIEKSVRFNSWLVVQLTNLPVYFKTIGNIFGIVADEIGIEWTKLTNLFSDVPIINFMFKTTGDTFTAIKKGLSDGDWSDLFEVAPDALKTGLLLAIGFTGASVATTLLSTSIKGSLLKAGFIASPTATMIAMASIGIGLLDATQSGDFESFGKDIIAGLALGLGVGALTKSATAGMLAFSIAVNFKLGNKISLEVPDSPIIDVMFKTTGDTFSAIKKGLSGGDWSDLFEVAPDALKTGLLLAIGFKGIQLATTLLSTAIKDSLLLAGFATSPATTMIAMASIGIGLVDAKQNGDYEAFAKDILAGLALGFGIGAFTKNTKTGMIAFTIAVNFELGSKTSSLFGNVKDKITDTFAKKYGSADVDEKFTELSENPINFNFKDNFPKISEGLGNIKDKIFNKSPGNIDYTDKLKGSSGFFNPYELHDQGQEVLTSGLIDKSKSAEYNNEALIAGTDIGMWFLKGLGKGIADIPAIAAEGGDSLLQAFYDVLDINSPSKKAVWIGNMFTAGLSNGIGDLGEDGKTSGTSFLSGVLDGFGDGEMQKRITAEWNSMLGQLNTVGDSSSTIAGITGSTQPSNNTSTSESPVAKVPSFLDKIGSIFGKMGASILPMITSFQSVNSLLNPLTTILSGVMSVLSPLIDKVLAPLNGVLTLIGQVVGKILAPVFEGLSVVTEYLGKAFIWLYNKAIVPVGNFLIKGANILANIFIGIVNGIISAINIIPGVNISKANYRALDAGALSDIAYSDLLTAGSSSDGTSSSYSSSSSVQSYDINVYQNFEQPVIGDGGLAKVGEYFVKAVQEYVGSGGKVTFIKA